MMVKRICDELPFKPDDITTESKNDLPTEYVTSYFEFDDRGFIVKQVSFKYYIFNGDIHPKTWYARKFNLTDYGIEATDWEEGILTDKYTIGFEKNFDSLEVKVDIPPSSIIIDPFMYNVNELLELMEGYLDN